MSRKRNSNKKFEKDIGNMASGTENINLELTFRSNINIFNEYRKNGILCDTVVIVGSKQFLCHRVILALKSLYFRSTLDSKLGRSNQEIEFKELDENAFEAILGVLYGEVVRFSLKEIHNILSLLSVAEFLKIDEIINQCLNFIRTNCNAEIALQAIVYMRNRDSDLIGYAKQYIKWNFNDTVQHTDFLEMPFDALKEVIFDHSTFVINEEILLKAIDKWVNFHSDERSQYASQLAGAILIERISEKCLSDVLNRELTNALKRIRLYKISNICSLIRNPNVYIFHQQKNHMNVNVLYSFRSSAVFAHHLEATVKLFDVQKVVNLKNHLYRLSYCSSSNENSFQFYSHYNGTWTDLPIASNCISVHDMVQMQMTDAIYVNAAKRQSPQEHDFNIYVYLENLERWDTIPMSVEAGSSGGSLISHENVLYLCGGFNRSNELVKNTYMYDPRIGMWKKLADMPKKRAFAASTAYKNEFYICGGVHDDIYAIIDPFENISSMIYKSVIVYDIRTNKWTPRRSLSQGMYEHTLLSNNGELLSMDAKCEFSEIFNISEKVWSGGPNTGFAERNEICATLF